MLSYEQWQKIKELFQDAIELKEDKRESFLDLNCKDQEMRKEVETLIKSFQEVEKQSFLRKGVINQLKESAKNNLVMNKKSKPSSNDWKKIFQNEFSLLAEAELILKNDFSKEQLLEKYIIFFNGYHSLLKQTIKITHIGDNTQNKLIKIQNELDKKNKELEKKNKELILSKEELVKSYQEVDNIFSTLSKILPGTVLDNKYRLENKIGSGGFGVVYRATHLALDKPVAIKIFRSLFGKLTSKELERFHNEGISACKVDHPNAVSVVDSAISSTGIAYLVMELLEGHTLEAEIGKNKTLTLKRCKEIIIPICDALKAAHSAGVIHRDIKPDNIFLHRTMGREMVKVLDFGIAKLIEEKTLSSKNLNDSTIIGTPEYIAPERFIGVSYGSSADIYSLGLTIYKMLTGKLPFDFEPGNPWLAMRMHTLIAPKSFEGYDLLIPKSLEAIIMRALSKVPANRPTAKELAEQFLAIEDEQNMDTIYSCNPVINSVGTHYTATRSINIANSSIDPEEKDS